jgi:hypothetical protein
VPDLTTEKNIQNLAVSEPESLSPQGLNPVHTCPNNSINSQGNCGQIEGVASGADPSEATATDGFIEVEQDVTRSVFDADFIKRVKFQDRGLIHDLRGKFFSETRILPNLHSRRSGRRSLPYSRMKLKLMELSKLNEAERIERIARLLNLADERKGDHIP